MCEQIDCGGMSASSAIGGDGKPKKIPVRFLAESGVRVSELCLGAMTFSVTGKGAW